MAVPNCDLVTQICGILRERQWTLGTAESCTGGWLAKTITDLPGISDVYVGGVVPYSNQLKMALLGVTGETLDRHGAVSGQVAEEMVLGFNQRFRTSVAVAITGIAGPDGGSIAKPVGLVYIATAVQQCSRHTESRFTGDRDAVRLQTVRQALEQLQDHLNS